MALIRDIKIGMSVNSNDFTAKLKKAEGTLRSFSSAASSSLRNIAIGIGSAFAVREVAQSIGTAVKASSDLTEQVSKSQVVFGKASASVEAKAKDMGDAFGYPKAQFIEGASSIGLIAKASGLAQEGAAKMGSDFASLAADASSFYNVPVEEALMAIRSGLVGEAEPMRRFGVLLNEVAVKNEAVRLGLAKVGAELTEGQKVQARASLITKGLADAQGDLARTASSVANMARTSEGRWTNAMSDIGAAIQPITEKLYSLRDSALRAMTEGINENADALKAWAAGAGSAEGAISSAFGGIGKSFGFVADTIQTLSIGLLAGQAAFVNLEYYGMAAVVGLGQAWDDFTASMGLNFPKAVDAAAKGMVESLGKAAADINKQLADASAAPWASEAIKKQFQGIGVGAGPVAGAGAAKAVPNEAAMAINAKLSKSVSDLEKSLRAEINTFGMAGKAAEIYKLKLAGATKEQIALVTSLDQQLQAKQLQEAIRTPLQTLDIERKRLQGLFDAGAINKEEFGKGMGLAREGAGFSPVPRFGAAIQAGSAEAYSAELKFSMRDSAKEEPAKKTAKATEKSADLLTQINIGIGKLVDKGLNAAAGQVAEIFAL